MLAYTYPLRILYVGFYPGRTGARHSECSAGVASVSGACPFDRCFKVSIQLGWHLQYHYKRAEHWTIIKGTGLVRLNDEEILLNVNDSIFIPKEALHRVTNNTDKYVEFIEIQIGDYLGEDDIVRIEDDFGRK